VIIGVFGALVCSLLGMGIDPVSTVEPRAGYEQLEVDRWAVLAAPFLLRGQLDPHLWQGLCGAVIGGPLTTLALRIFHHFRRTLVHS